MERLNVVRIVAKRTAKSAKTAAKAAWAEVQNWLFMWLINHIIHFKQISFDVCASLV